MSVQRIKLATVVAIAFLATLGFGVTTCSEIVRALGGATLSQHESQPQPLPPSTSREPAPVHLAPAGTMNRDDWIAVVDHAAEKSLLVRESDSPGNSSTGIIFVFAVMSLVAFVALLVWSWLTHSRLTMWIAAIGLLGPLLSGLAAVAALRVQSPARTAVESATADSGEIVEIPPIFISNGSREGVQLPSIPVFFYENGGLTIHNGEQEMLEQLVGALAGCGGSMADPVILTVKGYASSADFGNAPKAASDEKNRVLANDRARAVQGKLLSMANLRDGQGNWLDVIPYKWPKPEDMIAHRPYDDKVGGSARGRTQELLNRVAIVELTKAGGCTVK